jgi:hypothetical protein
MPAAHTIRPPVRTARSALGQSHKPEQAPLRTLVWGFLCQAAFYSSLYFFRIVVPFLRSVSLFDRRPFLRPDLPRRSDAAHSRGQEWPVFGPPPEAARRLLDRGEHGVTLHRVGPRDWIVPGARQRRDTPGRSEGSLRSCEARSSPHNLVCGEPAWGSTMMQSCASATGSGAAGPFYRSGTTEGWARVRIGAPPPRIVEGAAPARPMGAERVNDCPPRVLK